MKDHRARRGPAGMGQIADHAAPLARAAGKAAKARVHRHAFRLHRRDESAADLLEFWRIAGVVIARQQPRQLIKRRLVLAIRCVVAAETGRGKSRQAASSCFDSQQALLVGCLQAAESAARARRLAARSAERRRCRARKRF